MADDELISRIDGCEGDPETTLEESDGEVVITVVSTTLGAPMTAAETP